eukprot:gene32840-biopygen19542
MAGLFTLLFLVSGVEGGDGNPADLLMSGQPSSCKGCVTNGVWTYQENTADGKGYYRKRGAKNWPNYEDYMYLFFDRDSDDGKQTSCSRSWVNEWHIDSQRPSTTALQDLDGDGHCYTCGATWQADTSGSPRPPARASWGLACDGSIVTATLSFQPVCDTPTAFVYTYPRQWTVGNAGCGIIYEVLNSNTNFSKDRSALQHVLFL